MTLENLTNTGLDHLIESESLTNLRGTGNMPHMTRHEGLTYLNMSPEPLSKKDLSRYFSIAYTTASESVNKMLRDRLVGAVRSVGREACYGLTEKGKERLEYFDENGCGNQECRCHDR